MIDFRNAVGALALGFVVAAGATPALAQSKASNPKPGHAARAQASPGDAGTPGGMSLEREQAIRDCSGKANAYGQTTWGMTQGAHYRSCMMQHGQPE